MRANDELVIEATPNPSGILDLVGVRPVRHVRMAALSARTTFAPNSPESHGQTPVCPVRMARPARSHQVAGYARAVSVAVAEGRGEVRSLGTISNRAEAVRRLVGKLGKLSTVRVCYEAGPTGYALYWQLTRLGVQCEVIAPSLVPTKPGDRVKTDRRDAEKLARSYRAGDLTVVWVPDAKHEAIRDLVRAREAAKEDQLCAKHRLGKYFLRYGIRAPADAERGRRSGGSGLVACSWSTRSRTPLCWS